MRVGRIAVVLCGVLTMWPSATRAQQSFATASVKTLDPHGPRVIPNVDADVSDLYWYRGGPILMTGDLPELILFAYGIGDLTQYYAIRKDLPAWARDADYVVRATVENTAKRPPTKDDLRVMMRTLLAERFGLQVHTESREEPVWLLTVDAKPHPTPGLLSRLDQDVCLHPEQAAVAARDAWKKDPNAVPAVCQLLFTRPSATSAVLTMSAAGGTMAVLASEIAQAAQQGGGQDLLPVVDRTGLQGRFDLRVRFLRVRNGTPVELGEGEQPAPLFVDALREQAGLVLSKGRALVPVLVIDHVEKLTPD